MMNKSSLSRTVGGQKPLMVMTPYWLPVIECLKQEEQLNPQRATGLDSAVNIVTLVADVGQAVAYLREH